MVMIAGIGTIWIFDGYEQSLVSLFSSYIIHDYSKTYYKALATAYQLGAILGSILFGIVTYYFGRKKILMVPLLLFRSPSPSTL